jgi:hypothetical protein
VDTQAKGTAMKVINLDEDTVWDANLDEGRYRVTVIRLGPYGGVLILREADGPILLQREVGLSYDALFGPDVSDVQLWQDIATRFVDQRNVTPNGWAGIPNESPRCPL